MKLSNLIFNKLGNNFSVMLSNPEIEIMEKIEGVINIDGNNFFYEIEGVSTIHTGNNVLTFIAKLYSQEFEYPVSVRFLDNADIIAEAKEDLKGNFINSVFVFEFEKEEPISIFKLSAYKAKFFEFIKEDKYKIKIKEENLLKGLLELVYILYN